MTIAAYIADWGFHEDLKKEQVQYLTHVNYSFGLIKDGEVSIAHLQERKRLEKIQAQFPQIKVNLSVGGWGAGGFSEAVATEEGREKLSESAIRVIREMKLDGIDWDWEYPGSDAAGIVFAADDAEKMSLFLVLMGEKLKALGKETGKCYEQSIAVGAERTRDYCWEKVLPVLTTVNLMTYDMQSNAYCGHATNLCKAETAAFSVEESVQAFYEAGVPKEKIMLGAAFYFHVFEGVEEATIGKPFQKKGRNFGSDHLDDTWQRKWDKKAQAAYYVKGDTLISGDDEASLYGKYQYIQKEKLAGAILWELNHDRKNRLLPYLAGQKP